MPITFSEQYNVSKEIIESTEVFDVILDIDTRVFIDPALLELCTVPEFINARRKVEEYFSNIIVLLRHSQKQGDRFWKKADRLLTFHELSGTCFGYAENGTSGNAIGPVLRKEILSSIKELMVEGEADPVLFELLGVFQEGIGCDRISDLITFILKEDIVAYTERVVAECGIDTIIVNLGKKQYTTCRNPFNRKPLLLLPKTILSPLPIAESFDDIDIICNENERVRQEINAFFDLKHRKKLSKSEIYSLMRRNQNFKMAIVNAYKDIPKQAYDFESDPSGEYVWLPIAKQYVEENPLSLSEVSLTAIDDVFEVTKTICIQFKHLIEENGLWKLLYNDDGTSKHESAAQLLFYGIAHFYCVANNIDLTREGNNGRGPVDFKLSRGMSDKVVVETKLTSNSQLRHGIAVQLPIYMDQEHTKKAIYLIIDNGHPRALENFKKFYDELEQPTKEKIPYIVIDGTPKASASTA